MGTCGGLAQHFTAFLRRGDRGMPILGAASNRGPCSRSRQSGPSPIPTHVLFERGCLRLRPRLGQARTLQPTRLAGDSGVQPAPRPIHDERGTNRVAQEKPSFIFSARLGFVDKTVGASGHATGQSAGAHPPWAPLLSSLLGRMQLSGPLSPGTQPLVGPRDWKGLLGRDQSLGVYSEFWTVTAER